MYLYYNALLLSTSAECNLNLTRGKPGYEQLAKRNLMRIWDLGEELDMEIRPMFRDVTGDSC